MLEPVLRRHHREEQVLVMQPSMPPLEEYAKLLGRIWENRWLTNNGEFHQDLERGLAEYLGVPHLNLFCNGTIALLVALAMLRIDSGEVLTTPFTFPATPHVLYWNRIQPVFCDIDPETRNLDPARAERLITSETKAILATHVYGTPCDVEAIQALADRHGLYVLYDAAHAFGVTYRGRSLASYGDASMLSFHATKLFSTIEGGALVVKSKAQHDRVNFLKNFGIRDEETVIGPGINGKMNEFQAAYGLLHLDMVGREIASRGKIAAVYQRELADVPGISLLPLAQHTEPNYAYFPIFVDASAYGWSRDELHAALKRCNIVARKYFYPLCSRYACYSALPSAHPGNLPIAEQAAEQVLCLPIHGSMTEQAASSIAQVVREIGAVA